MLFATCELSLHRHVGWHSTIEQEIQLRDEKKRADILLTLRVLDITVVHQQTDTAPAAAAPALKARTRKERQYLAEAPATRLPGREEVMAVVHVASGFLNDPPWQFAELVCADLATKLVHVQRLTVSVAKRMARHRIYGGLMRTLAAQEVRVPEAGGDLL